MTEQNYEAAAGWKRKRVVPGAGHAMSYPTDQAGCQRPCWSSWTIFWRGIRLPPVGGQRQGDGIQNLSRRGCGMTAGAVEAMRKAPARQMPCGGGFIGQTGDQLSIRLLPSISGGHARPRMSRMVGAMSARRPGWSLASAPTRIKGTGCGVGGHGGAVGLHHLLGVAVVGGDHGDAAHGPGGVHHLAHAGVHRLHRLHGGVIHGRCGPPCRSLAKFRITTS